MSDNLNVLLVGCGTMGTEYAQVLKCLGARPIVVGNSQDGAKQFQLKTNIEAYVGGIEQYLKTEKNIPSIAIVATPMTVLASVTKALQEAGVKNILVEKPAGMCINDIYEISEFAKKKNVKVYVAYNRRFFASSMLASKIIQEDGGLLSFDFEFTEWAKIVEKTAHPESVKQNWLLANSTHVIDLAFCFGGYPIEMSSYVAGELDWHKGGAIYSGAGKTEKGCLFSYQANWLSAGRWGLELLTSIHRIIMRPMEKLFIQRKNSVVIEEIDINDEMDKKYKPGIYEQTKAFLYDRDNIRLCSIEEHLRNMKLYEKIAGL